MKANEKGRAVGAAHDLKVKAQGKDTTDYVIRQAGLLSDLVQ